LGLALWGASAIGLDRRGGKAATGCALVCARRCNRPLVPARERAGPDVEAGLLTRHPSGIFRVDVLQRTTPGRLRVCCWRAVQKKAGLLTRAVQNKITIRIRMHVPLLPRRRARFFQRQRSQCERDRLDRWPPGLQMECWAARNRQPARPRCR
jgi:hypothetical protein